MTKAAAAPAAGTKPEDQEGGVIDFSGEEDGLLSGGIDDGGAGHAGDGKPAGEAAGGKKPGEDDDAGRAAMVPSHRLREVSEHASELERENAFLKGQLSQREAAPAAQKKEERQKVDIDALEDKIFEATQTGDKGTAIKLRREINDELKRQAKEEASAEATSVAETRIAASAAAQEQANLDETVEQVITRFPMLDSNSSEKDALAIKMVLGVRADLEIQGVRPATALKRAVREVTDRLQIKPVGTAAANDEGNPGQRRNRQALSRAGETSQRQPERAGGIGNRSGAAIGSTLSDQQIRQMGNTKEEKQKMFAGDIPGMEDA